MIYCSKRLNNSLIFVHQSIMPSTLIIVLVVAIILSAVAITYAILRRNTGKGGDASSNVLLEVVEGLRRELKEASHQQRSETSEHLDRIHTQLHRSQTEAQKLFQEVTEQLTKIDATNKQVLDFSSQLQNLQNILKNPKQRGVLGEYWLESLLGNVLPPESYKMQYQMGVDEAGAALIADSVIFVRDYIIPIDAKFSLENYNRMTSRNQRGRERVEKSLKLTSKNALTKPLNIFSRNLGP